MKTPTKTDPRDERREPRPAEPAPPRRAGKVLIVFAAAFALTGMTDAKRLPAPTVSGPRDTAATRPVYVFRAKGATGFRCAFDSTRLRRCAARYSESLTPGRHTLRVRSVGRRGAVSRITTVRILVREPVPALQLGAPVAVGPGAGVPAPAGSLVWVPTTADGRVVSVSQIDGSITGRTTVVAPGGSGDLDSAVAPDGGTVWTASDAGARVSRIIGGQVTTVPVSARPGGLTYGGGSVWSFHFLQRTITRIDGATGAATALQGPDVRATGIAYEFRGAGSLWVLATGPAQVLELDPATMQVRRTLPLRPSFPQKRTFIETWGLASADEALWATLPNHDAVARIDSATGEVRYLQLNYGRPFGIAVGAGSAWVATDRAVVRLDEETGQVVGASSLPTANRTGFMSIAYGYRAAWVTNYDRGTLTRVTP
jgi:streptogramin lyase